MVSNSSNLSAFKEIDLSFNSVKLYTNGQKLFLEFLKDNKHCCNFKPKKNNYNIIFIIFILAIILNFQRLCIHFNLQNNKYFSKYYKLIQKNLKKYNLDNLIK